MMSRYSTSLFVIYDMFIHVALHSKPHVVHFVLQKYCILWICCSPKRMHACMPKIHVSVCMYMLCAHIRWSCSDMCTYIRTYIHTYIHTHMFDICTALRADLAGWYWRPLSRTMQQAQACALSQWPRLQVSKHMVWLHGYVYYMYACMCICIYLFVHFFI